MNNNPTSEKLTFLELISKHKIEIPIIQRDYAQGREGKADIRKNFLGALYNAVVKDKKIELDFVYGIVKNNVLQPLDGQQRLTTLFLLHWFIAIKENKLDDELKNLLTKFTYETRTSSREFCIDLINKGIAVVSATCTLSGAEGYNPEKNISELIIDSSWFFLSWKKDPTIKAMLTMLDAIQEKFKHTDNIWDNIDNISFHYIELHNFGLSDDLYIKMNARGKPLTDFENFKAKFEQYVKQNDWENNVSPTETFAHQIDTLWTDLFWNYRNDENVFDDKILKFMSGIAIMYYAQNQEIYEDKTEKELESKNKTQSVTDDTIKKERIEKRISLLFNEPHELKPEDFSQIGFTFLVQCFDVYAQLRYKLVNNISLFDTNLWTYVAENQNLFTENIKLEQTTYKQSVLFYAQTKFLLLVKNEQLLDEKEKFNEWMRVVRNIVKNATIDSATTFIEAIHLIKELSNGCNDVYNYLSKNPIQSQFAGEQVKEEVLKAKLIANNKEWKEVINVAEDHLMFQGQIKFLFDNNEMSNIDTFKKWYEKVKNMFNNNGVCDYNEIKYKTNALLIRSLMSCLDQWVLLEIYLDSTRNTWKSILKDEKFIPYFQKILKTDNIETLLNRNSPLTEEIHKFLHEDIFKSELLSCIVDNCRLRYSYILFPDGAKAAWKKYVIGNERNTILAELIEKNIITTWQQLKTNEGKTIPYFWGWDIDFEFDGNKYRLKLDNRIEPLSGENDHKLEKLEDLQCLK